MLDVSPVVARLPELARRLPVVELGGAHIPANDGPGLIHDLLDHLWVVHASDVRHYNSQAPRLEFQHLRVFEIGFAGHPLFFAEGVVTPADGSLSMPAVVMLLITARMGVDVDVLPVGVLVADTLFSHAPRL